MKSVGFFTCSNWVLLAVELSTKCFNFCLVKGNQGKQNIHLATKTTKDNAQWHHKNERSEHSNNKQMKHARTKCTWPGALADWNFVSDLPFVCWTNVKPILAKFENVCSTATKMGNAMMMSWCLEKMKSNCDTDHCANHGKNEQCIFQIMSWSFSWLFWSFRSIISMLWWHHEAVASTTYHFHKECTNCWHTQQHLAFPSALKAKAPKVQLCCGADEKGHSTESHPGLGQEKPPWKGINTSRLFFFANLAMLTCVLPLKETHFCSPIA